MTILYLHTEYLTVQSHPTGNQWLVIWAVLLCCILGLVLGFFFFYWIEIESLCSMLSLNYLKREGWIDVFLLTAFCTRKISVFLHI